MKNIAAAIAFALCAVFGFLQMASNLQKRAIHADESEQAMTFLKLYKDGDYKYNPNGPHGPILYYWANAAQKIKNTLSTPTAPENIAMPDLRKTLLPAAALALLCCFAVAAQTGFAAAACAAAALALAPLWQIYGAYFVQEIFFSSAVFLFALAAFSFSKNRSLKNALLVGLSAGAAQICKETSVFAFASAAAAALATTALYSKGAGLKALLKDAAKPQNLAAIFVGFLIPVAVFYSSFGDNPRGIIDAFASYFAHFAGKSVSAAHTSGADFYIKLLFAQKSGGVYFGSAAITLLVAAGTLAALANRAARGAQTALFFALTAIINIAILCIVPYKTPWLLLSPTALMCVPAGFFAARIFELKNKFASIAACAATVALGCYQTTLDRPAATRYADDPRNPFLYSHTVSDENNLANRVFECARFSQYKNEIPVAFVGSVSPWPLPWQLRNLPNAGFWTTPPDNLDRFDVIITDAFRLKQTLEKFDASKYAPDIFGIRKNTLLHVFIRREIFEKITE